MALAVREKHRLGLCTEYMKGPSAANYPRYTDHQAIVCKHLTPEVSRDRHLPTARAHKITENPCSQSVKTTECKNILQPKQQIKKNKKSHQLSRDLVSMLRQ